MITPIYTLVSWDTGIQLRWGSAGCRTWVTGRMNWSKIRSEITRPAKADAIGHALGSGSMSAFKAIMFADPDPFLLSLLLLLLLLLLPPMWKPDMSASMTYVLCLFRLYSVSPAFILPLRLWYSLCCWLFFFGGILHEQGFFSFFFTRRDCDEWSSVLTNLLKNQVLQ